MFGRSRPVVLEPYGRRRSRWRPPRWLVLWATGLAMGAAGVVFVQEQYLPPRLSPAESAQLRQSFERADGERQSLQRQSADLSSRLQSALAEKKALADDLSTARGQIERLRGDLASTVAALPADPRGGAVEVRAGRFAATGGTLVYDVVLTRSSGQKPLAGALQLTLAGQPLRGPETTVALKPVTLSLTGYEVVRGSQPLPEGFRAREVTVQVLDRVGGQALGRRVMLVK